jgi:hypothetical protein
MNTLKNKIKELAQQQVALKNQRKTINLVGERTISPDEASYKHYSNRYNLRELYMTYGILRGKDPKQIESNPKIHINMNFVQKIIDIYQNEFKTVESCD